MWSLTSSGTIRIKDNGGRGMKVEVVSLSLLLRCEPLETLFALHCKVSRRRRGGGHNRDVEEGGRGRRAVRRRRRGRGKKGGRRNEEAG